ncbi:hypothetical protein ABBQ32_009153 [Trebouxia sp. C0010 RCD-2024]
MSGESKARLLHIFLAPQGSLQNGRYSLGQLQVTISYRILWHFHHMFPLNSLCVVFSKSGHVCDILSLICSPLGQQHLSAQGEQPSAGSSFSGRHGSIASCASLPDDTSLPQPDFSSTPPPLSRQASEAPSSCFDGPEALSNTAAAAEVQSSSSAAPRNSLRHNRAVSWSPQTTARLIATDSSPFTPDQEHHRTIPAFGGHRQSDDGAAHLGGQTDEWVAEAGLAPPVGPGTTELLDHVLPVDLHAFCHKFLADGAAFWPEFHESRGDKQICLTSWSRHSALGHIRELRFVSPIKALIGPPQAECFQNQRYRMYRDNHLVLETSQTMPNIPFGDHFTVEVRWDISQAPGTPSHCRVQSCVSVPFSKATWWKKAIQKGSIDSCKEAHQDWLAKVQAALSAPPHVPVLPTPTTLASLHSLHPPQPTPYTGSLQGEVDKLMEQLPKDHREAVARVISIASQGSICTSTPRRSNAADSEEAMPADKQCSHTLARMSKTTRFADSPAQQDSPTPLPGSALTAINSGIPTGATAQWWMATRLAPALGGTNMLLLALAFTIIGLQVAILLSRFATNASGPAQQGVVSINPYPEAVMNKMDDVQEGYALVQQRLDSVVRALAANGINI